MDARKNWRYCVVGNIVKTRIDKDGILRYGTSAFTGGTKVYLCRNGAPEDTEVTVMGLGRGKRYEFVRIPKDCIENVRCSKVYKPMILNYMADPEAWECWWENEPEEKADTKRFVDEWNKHQNKN